MIEVGLKLPPAIDGPRIVAHESGQEVGREPADLVADAVSFEARLRLGQFQS
jgi:hypothetical protein